MRTSLVFSRSKFSEAISSILSLSSANCASRSLGIKPLLPDSRSIARLLIEQSIVFDSDVCIVKSNVMRRASYPVILPRCRGIGSPNATAQISFNCRASSHATAPDGANLGAELIHHKGHSVAEDWRRPGCRPNFLLSSCAQRVRQYFKNNPPDETDGVSW